MLFTMRFADIENGVAADPAACPVSKCIRRRLPPGYIALVGNGNVKIKDCPKPDPGHSTFVKLPTEVMIWIREYDKVCQKLVESKISTIYSIKELVPISFELSIDMWLVRLYEKGFISEPVWHSMVSAGKIGLYDVRPEYRNLSV